MALHVEHNAAPLPTAEEYLDDVMGLALADKFEIPLRKKWSFLYALYRHRPDLGVQMRPRGDRLVIRIKRRKIRRCTPKAGRVQIQGS